MTSLEQNPVAVVEDDAAVRDSLRFLLESAGHNVETYSSGTEFLVKADPKHLACLVVDQHMPLVTGLRLVEQLRRDGVTVPTLLITGAPTPALARQAARLSVRVLEKPLLQDDILACIEAASAR